MLSAVAMPHSTAVRTPLQASATIRPGSHSSSLAVCIMTVRVSAAGICNDKTLHIEQDQGNVKVVRNRKGSMNRPVSAKVGAARKRHIRLLSGNLGKEVQGYRPDLKVRTCVPDTGVLSPQRSSTGVLGKDGPGYRPGLKGEDPLVLALVG